MRRIIDDYTLERVSENTVRGHVIAAHEETFPEFCRYNLRDNQGLPLLLNEFQTQFEHSGLFIVHRRTGASLGLAARILFGAVRRPKTNHLFLTESASGVEQFYGILEGLLLSSRISVVKRSQRPFCLGLENGSRICLSTSSSSRRGMSGSVYLHDITHFSQDFLVAMRVSYREGSLHENTDLFAVGGRPMRQAQSLFLQQPPTVLDIVANPWMDAQEKRRIFQECDYDTWINEYQV